MATVAEIDRVQALVKRLLALGAAQRGDLIRAQQWNDLVGMVVEIAQAALGSGAQGEVPPHEHPDQVKINWLSPSLRTAFERGPLSDPAAANRMSEVEARVRALSDDLEKLRATLGNARDRVAEITTRDLSRDSDMNEIRLTVGALTERRDDVLELRKTLGSIAEKVDQAVTASARLTIGGQPADLDAVNRRIAAIEELRTHLTGPNGTLLDAAELERRLATLQNTLVTQEQLEKAIRQRPAAVDPSVLDQIKGELSVGLREESKASFAALAGEVRGETETKLGGIDALVSKRIDERVPPVVEASAESLRQEIAANLDHVRADAQSFAGKAVTDLAQSLHADFDAKLGKIGADVPVRVSEEVAKTLSAALAPLQESVAAARSTATAVAANLSALSDVVQQARARVEQVASSGDDAVKKARKELLDEINKREAANKTDLDQRFKDIEGRIKTRFTDVDTHFTTLESGVNAGLDARAAAAAQAALTTQVVALRGEMEEIARSQSLALEDQVREKVRVDVEAGLSERIAAETKKATKAELTSDTFSKQLEVIVRRTR